jgi:hypothetical protein
LLGYYNTDYYDCSLQISELHLIWLNTLVFCDCDGFMCVHVFDNYDVAHVVSDLLRFLYVHFGKKTRWRYIFYCYFRQLRGLQKILE